MQHLGDEHRDLHKIPSEDMPDILGQFYMLVLKKDGEPMNASSLGTLHQSLALAPEFFPGRFDTSGSMVPRLVPEVSSLDAFCDRAAGAGAGAGAGAVGIGDSRSWITNSL